MRRALIFACSLLLLCALPGRATPGGTDVNGGHTDKRTGEYHFHHGYPAHQHINGVCPLDPNFTSNVIIGKSEQKGAPTSGSEDKNDVIVFNPAKLQDGAFKGIEKPGKGPVIASSATLALIIIGGFLSTVKWREK